MKQRKIPILMASQHPDNATAPSWHGSPFISTYEEPEECYRAYNDLGCEEYMWDWEGKLVDEAVVDRLLRRYQEFFRKKQLGRDVFLTYRIPNVSHEPGYRVARAYMGILSAEEFARDIGVHSPPVFEVILPMTEKASDLLRIMKTFYQTAQFKAKVFSQKPDLSEIGVIPLFEGVEHIANSDKVIAGYLKGFRKQFGHSPSYMRPFIARSDPALNSGIVATTLGIKISLSRMAALAESEKIPMYPIIGPGGLPFRGHLNPQNVHHFVEEYAGVTTAVIQSSFRFDWPEEQVKASLDYLKKTLPKKKAVTIPPQEEKQLRQAIAIFEKHYQKTVEKIADLVNSVSDSVPSRRERMQHIGLFGYSRKLGKKQLPRAIKYTGALYSLGVPPEIIGVGRGLREVHKQGLLDVVLKYYRFIEHDLKSAGYFLNKENLNFLIRDGELPKHLLEDVEGIEELFGFELGPRTLDHFIHRNSTSNVYFLRQAGEPFEKEIEWAAKARKSIG